MAEYLLAKAGHRRAAQEESSAFNMLTALSLVHYETMVHSKIIFFLLSSGGEQKVFLRLFLSAIGISQSLLDEEWKVYRERASEDCGRMKKAGTDIHF